jgi:sporulation protein YlmC with PRC-barrel domain
MELNDRDDRDGRDAAGIGPYAREREGLTSLSSLGSWKVSEGEPDIRGWEIRTVSGRQLGAVADLMIDADAGEVVMIDVDLPGTDRHTFVPIRVAQIDRAKRVVLMDSADLPDSDLARASSAGISLSRPVDVGTVRYPHSDREVVVDHSTRADSPPRDDISEERRRADRRRIDRLSTDL